MIDIVMPGAGNGRGNVCMPVRRFPVYRSGTVATRSHVLASARATEKLPTIVVISRFDPCFLNEMADALTKLACPGSRHQTAAGPHQQRMTSGFVQSRQRPAHR